MRGKGTKLFEGGRDFWHYYANPNSGRLRLGLFHSGIVHGALFIQHISLTFPTSESLHLFLMRLGCLID